MNGRNVLRDTKRAMKLCLNGSCPSKLGANGSNHAAVTSPLPASIVTALSTLAADLGADKQAALLGMLQVSEQNTARWVMNSLYAQLPAATMRRMM